MTARWISLRIRPRTSRRFKAIDRDCNWLGAHRDVRWTPMLHGRVLVAQCQACRVVVGAVVQRVPEDGWEGCID